jgi:hypothetical protein
VHKILKIKITLFIYFIALIPFAEASSLSEVKELFFIGRFDEAQTEAIKMNTAEGYAIASESLLAQILLGEVGKLNTHSKLARSLAKKAITLDPSLYNAQLQYAISDGFVTRTSGAIKAWQKKMPSKTLTTIKKFREMYPNDALGLALEGAWHLGVIRKVGEKNGRDWFGASLDEGVNLYNKAIAISSDDTLIEVNYAMSLLAVDANRWRPLAEGLLLNGTNRDEQDYLSKQVKLKSMEVLRVISDDKKSKAYAQKFLEGKPIR